MEAEPDPAGSEWGEFLTILFADPILVIVPAAAALGIVVVLVVLTRYLLGGIQVHWSAQLTRRTDWTRLKEGAFVKVVGTAGCPDRVVSSPLAGTPCVAYRIHVAYRDGDRWAPCGSQAESTSFHVLDEHGRALLIAEKDFHMYGATSREWTFDPGEVPPEFARQCPAVPAAALRFREEVVELGSRVSCIGAMSTLKQESGGLISAGALRPAYALLMFHEHRIPWSKLTDLHAGDWAQLASWVLVSPGDDGG